MEDPQAKTVWLGVTGHRPNKLPAASLPRIGAQCGEVLDALAATAERVGIVSALAEGADRLVAALGLARGLAFRCVLPFAVSEYERDFAADPSRAEFHALLAAAKSVEVLDGNPSDRPAGYERAGRIMLDRSDVLLALWDGQKAAGRGGSAQVIAEARARGMPVIWIYTQKERAPIVCLAGLDDAPLVSSIERLRQKLARPPVTARSPPPVSS